MKMYLLTSVLIALTTFSCKPRRSGSEVTAANAAPPGGVEGLSGYEMSPDFVESVGRHIGCDAASKVVGFHREASLSKSVHEIMNAKDVYATVSSQFLDPASVTKNCSASGKAGNTVDTLPGIMRIYKKAREAGYGLTFVVQGGFGSHLTPSGALAETRDRINAIGQQLDKGSDKKSLRAWRIECDNSYASDEHCSPYFVKELKRLEQEQPSTVPQVYLFWGYSKGGNTIIQALASLPEVRSKTLAVVTVGTPVAGSHAIMMATPAITAVIKSHADLLKDNPPLAVMAPVAYGMTPASSKGYLKLLNPDQSQLVLDGMKSLRFDQRNEFLFSWLAKQDYSRQADPVYHRQKLPVFHIAGVVDPAEFRPFPLLTLKDGQLTTKEGSMNDNQLKEIAFIGGFRDFPINDACVALQHSVIPKKALPKGLESELLGIIKLDHLAIQLGWGSAADGPNATPAMDLVDAVSDTIATRLEGGKPL